MKFYRENTVNINLSFPGVDLTGATVYFTVKADYDDDGTDSSALIKKDVTSHIDAANGQTVVVLTPSDTDVEPGKYVYDIKLKKSSGEQTTLKVDKCQILPAVTLRG